MPLVTMQIDTRVCCGRFPDKAPAVVGVVYCSECSDGAPAGDDLESQQSVSSSGGDRRALSRGTSASASRLREIIKLRSIEGLSTRETADALGLTEGAVKTRAARARAELRRLHYSSPANGRHVPPR